MENVAESHNLKRFMTFGTECISAEWDDSISKWKVILRDVGTHEENTVWSDVFIYAVGRLNNYKFPNITGRDKFQGTQVHTANWPAETEVKDKRVVVIGNGASAVQCVSSLQPGKQLKYLPNHAAH